MDNHKCVFCETADSNVLFQNEFGYEKCSLFEVSQGHLHIIRKRHFGGYFDATEDEKIVTTKCDVFLSGNISWWKKVVYTRVSVEKSCC